MTSRVTVSCLSNPRDFLRLIGRQKVKLTWAANKDLMSMILMHMGPTAGRKVVNKLVENGKISWDENFEVEAILDHVVEKGTDYYLIKWEGWSNDYNTWEPKANLVDCQDLLTEFHLHWNPLSTAGSRSAIQQGRGAKRLSSESAALRGQPESKKKRVQELLEHIMQYNESLTALSLLEAWEADERGCNSVGRPPTRLVSTKSRTNGSVTNKRTKAYRTRKQETQQALKAWEVELNRINSDPAGICVENNVDFEGPPHNFHYTNDYMPGDGITIHSEPVVGCECAAGAGCLAEKHSCCAANAGSTFAYYSNRRLRVEQGTAIYECNKRCRCGPDCPNRVVQLGRKHKVCIFRTDNGRGWGVKAMQPIKKGTFVMEYVGEVVTNEEAERRGKNYDAEGMTYLFDLDYQDTDCVYTVDAGVYGNVSHFVNHSCDPNLTVYVVWINNLDPRLPRIALFSSRDIKKGEELTFDYLMTGDTTEGIGPELAPDMTENSLDGSLSAANDTINSVAPLKQSTDELNIVSSMASLEQLAEKSNILSCGTIPSERKAQSHPVAPLSPLKMSNKHNIIMNTSVMYNADVNDKGNEDANVENKKCDVNVEDKNADDVKKKHMDDNVNSATDESIIAVDLLTPENSQLVVSFDVTLDTAAKNAETQLALLSPVAQDATANNGESQLLVSSATLDTTTKNAESPLAFLSPVTHDTVVNNAETQLALLSPVILDTTAKNAKSQHLVSSATLDTTTKNAESPLALLSPVNLDTAVNNAEAQCALLPSVTLDTIANDAELHRLVSSPVAVDATDNNADVNLALSSPAALSTKVNHAEAQEKQPENIPSMSAISHVVNLPSSPARIQSTMTPEVPLMPCSEVEMTPDEGTMTSLDVSNPGNRNEVRMDGDAKALENHEALIQLSGLQDTPQPANNKTISEISYPVKFGGDLIKTSVSSIADKNSKEVAGSEVNSEVNGADPSFFKRSKINPPATKYRLMCQCGAQKCRKYLY